MHKAMIAAIWAVFMGLLAARLAGILPAPPTVFGIIAGAIALAILGTWAIASSARGRRSRSRPWLHARSMEHVSRSHLIVPRSESRSEDRLPWLEAADYDDEISAPEYADLDDDLPEDHRRVQGLFGRTIERTVIRQVPRTMPLGEASPVSITVASRELQTLIATLGLGGEDNSIDTVPLTLRIRASLSCESRKVEIAPEMHQVQTVLIDEDTVFRWTVRPQAPGRFTLRLTLTNLVTDAGAEHGRELIAREYEVSVLASRWQRFSNWFDRLDSVWKVLGVLSAIASLVAAAYGAYRFVYPEPKAPVTEQHGGASAT